VTVEPSAAESPSLRDIFSDFDSDSTAREPAVVTGPLSAPEVPAETDLDDAAAPPAAGPAETTAEPVLED
jgi:hypothetical protein